MSGITTKHHIEFECVVEGEYTPAEKGSYWEPGHPDDAHACAVYLVADGKRVEVPESLWSDISGELADEILQAARERAAEMRAEDRRDGL